MTIDTVGNTSCFEIDMCCGSKLAKCSSPTGPHHVNKEGQRIQVKISPRALDIHIIQVTAHCWGGEMMKWITITSVHFQQVIRQAHLELPIRSWQPDWAWSMMHQSVNLGVSVAAHTFRGWSIGSCSLVCHESQGTVYVRRTRRRVGVDPYRGP
jgi:hypothetical protein